MPIYLPAEYETTVSGTGDGFICFSQKRLDGEEMIMFLSLHQFQTILTMKKQLLERL
jgi:hypothetical protein